MKGLLLKDKDDKIKHFLQQKLKKSEVYEFRTSCRMRGTKYYSFPCPSEAFAQMLQSGLKVHTQMMHNMHINTSLMDAVCLTTRCSLLGLRCSSSW